VIGLQEVSRGWVINGSTDMLHWLTQRLDMPYVWNSTEGETWGIAILSRYPLTNAAYFSLPPDDLLLHRGVLRADVSVGTDNPLHIMNTHYHHITEDGDIRVQQSQALLELWAERPFTILMGDLNAPPEALEMQLIQEAGFIEGVSEAGITPGYTYSSIDPYTQLDYIWYTGEINASELIISEAQASDHLGIAATFSTE